MKWSLKNNRAAFKQELSAIALSVLVALPAVAQPEGTPQGDPSGQTFGQPPTASQYAPYPPPDSGYVTDLANLLTVDEEERIEHWLWEAESRTGVEIAVVTIHSIKDFPGTANGSIEAFATGLFDAYGIGNMPKNDGVLLLVASGDRKARIELGAGYGRTRDNDATSIMSNEIVPHFADGDYAAGITDGVEGILSEFAGLRFGINWTLIGAIAGVIILIPIAISLFRNGKRGWGWVAVGVIIILLLIIIQVIVTMAKHRRSGSSSSWGSGGFGGGFGGGFSGGGGATGSW